MFAVRKKNEKRGSDLRKVHRKTEHAGATRLCRVNITANRSSYNLELKSTRMASRYVAAVIALLFVSLISAVSVSLIVPPSALIPNPNTLIPSTSATLTSLGRTFTAPIQRDNRFTFRNITTGSYLLDIHCRDYVFAPLRLDIGNDNVEVWQTFRGHEWDNKGEKLLERPIQLKALAQKDYYEHRAGCKFFIELSGNSVETW